jgi:hypothetical protein
MKIDDKWVQKGVLFGFLLGILELLFGEIPRWRAAAAGKTGDAANWSVLLFWVGPIVVVFWGFVGALMGAITGAVVTFIKRKP